MMNDVLNFHLSLPTPNHSSIPSFLYEFDSSSVSSFSFPYSSQSLFPSCRHLDLSNNSLNTLPRETLQTAPLLESLVLQANPWRCDCSMNWFLHWIQAHPGDYHVCSIIYLVLLFCLPHAVP